HTSSTRDWSSDVCSSDLGLLAAMRRDGDEAELTPQPGLEGLDSLLEEIGRAGLPVQLHVDGEPVALPRGIDLSAYRIVQEGLTKIGRASCRARGAQEGCR